MDVITLIADAPPLINQIHGLKQWIYDGSVRIVVPLCTLNEVERQYKASLAAKEVPKEPVAKKASGRASRREEQPLFDINPRTTWEFLCREREKNDSRVEFQKEGEEFSPWKEEEEQEQTSESQREPPSSFADALLRKLNITNGSNSSALEDESKPKLISRISDSKSSGTHRRPPKVSSKAVPSSLTPFFSYALWKIYESGIDHLKPITYEILADESRMKDTAEMLSIGTCDWPSLRSRVVDQSHGGEQRSTYGQLEREFLSHKDASSISAPCKDKESSTVPHRDSDATNSQPDTAGPQTQTDQKTHPEQENGNSASSLKPASYLQENQEPAQRHNPEIEGLDGQNFGSMAASTKIETSPLSQPQTIKPAETSTNGAEGTESKGQDDSDLDSEEEIIVFNPRAKRGSWRPRTPAGASEPSHSRPATASGPNQEATESPKPAKSPIKSTLKPQSPVFTPGHLYSPVANLAENDQAINAVIPTNGDSKRPPRSPGRSPVLAHSKPHSAKSHPGKAKTTQAPTSDDRRQQSEIIIQRQREAIHRQTSAVPKPPPRRVQKEPTDNPTIIDPDAFDRSYVVQPVSQPSDRGGKRRSGPKHKRGSSKGNAQQASAANPEPDEDFVLKSGAPRGSMRGKGKLFVP